MGLFGGPCGSIQARPTQWRISMLFLWWKLLPLLAPGSEPACPLHQPDPLHHWVRGEILLLLPLLLVSIIHVYSSGAGLRPGIAAAACDGVRHRTPPGCFWSRLCASVGTVLRVLKDPGFV
jgi:hypothetical protein